MELRRRTLRTGTKNVSESTEMAGSSHNGETESFSSESSAAENSSLERLEREKSKSSEDMVASDSSPKGRSSLFRKFRIYLSSLVKRVNVRESTQRSVQGEHCDSSRESGEENTPRRNLFEDEWLQTSEWEQSNKLESQTSDHTKNEHWEEENPSQTEPKQLSVQTSTRGVGSYDYHKALSGSSLEESERGQIITRSRGMQTPANSEHTETTREGNYLLNSAKSEAKGRRKYTRESSGKRPQETSQKPVIVKAKNARKTNSSIQEAARVHDDQLSQALSEDFSETISYQELRSLCKRLGIKATGKKTQLMGKLRHYVKSQETASEASVSRKEKPDLPENTEQKNREVKGPREASISSKLKRGRDREGMKAEISGKTAEHSLYSMETIALARAVLQHLQSQQRTISVEEYELYQNILKNAVQKPSSQLAISEYPFGGAVGSSRVRKRTRTPPSDPKRRKRNQPLSTMKIVEVSIGEDVDSFSSQPIRQPSLKRQRVYSMDVLPFEKVDEHSPKSTPKLTPVPVRPTVSRQTELTGNPLTPVDVVRTFMGSSATEIDKKKSESKPEGSEQGISISGSAFTTPIVSTNRNNSQSSSFVSRKGTLSENRYFRKQDTLQSQPLFSGKSDWTKTADISGLKRNWDIGKERIYDFRKNISPTPSKASASDTARKILETLERIAGNSAERKKPPPVTLDSLRKRHRTEEQNRTQTESKLSQDWNDSCLETGSIHAHHESGRHSNENVKEPRPDNHSEHTLEDQGYNKEFSVNLAKDLFAKHIDTTSRKEVAREVEDKADSTEEPSNTIRTYTKKSNEEQFESQTPQQSYSQHFPVISSITKSLMSDKSIENMVSSPSAKANDNNLDWKTREELKEKDNNLDFRENKKTEEHSRSSLLTSFDSVDHARPNDNNIIEQSENLTDNNAFQKNSVSVINEASSAHATIEARKEQVQDSDTKDDRNSTWTRTNDGHSKNDNFIQNRLESQGESGQDNDEKEEQSTFFTTSHAKDDKSSFLTGSETKGTSDNQTVAATMTSSFSYTSPSMGENFSMFSKPSSFQANILPQSSSHCLVQTGSATSAAWFGSTIGDHFKANSSQSENDRSTLETPSEASTAASVAQSMSFTTNVMTNDTTQPFMSQSYPSLFASAPNTSLFLGASTSSNIFTSSSTLSTTTTLKDAPSVTFNSPFSASSSSEIFHPFSSSQSSLPSSNFTSQQSFPATSNQFFSSPFTASSNVTSSFSSSGFQGFTASASTDIFSKASLVNQKTAQEASLFSASAFTSSASAVPNPFSTVHPFTTDNSSSSFTFGASPAFSSSSFQMNASPFSNQFALPQSSFGMNNNPFTAPFQFGASSHATVFSNDSSGMQFTGASSFALGSQNTSSTSGRKMVRARRLRQ